MKYILLTESQIKNVINHTLNERLGVPDNIINTSHSIYDIIVNEIPKLNFNIPDDTEQDENDNEMNTYNINLDGNYTIKDQKFNHIIFKVEVSLIDNSDLIEPDITSMTHYGQSKKGTDYKIRVNELSDTVTIGASFVVPLDWSGPMSELSEILLSEKDSIVSRSSFAHELMHSYDQYKNPYDITKNRVNYTASKSMSVGVAPIDELFHYMYYVDKLENAVKATEVASDMKRENVTKANFKEFIKRNHTFLKLDKLRKLTYNDLVHELKSNMHKLNPVFEQPDFPIPELKHKSDDEKIKAILNVTYQSYLSHKGSIMSRSLISNFIENAIGPSAFPPDKKKYFIKYMNSAARFQNNPLEFYKNEIKNINKKAEYYYRKISKLYDYEIK